ncbi:MAG: tol-pal system protein YbgF [Acidobacteriota bacterium]
MFRRHDRSRRAARAWAAGWGAGPPALALLGILALGCATPGLRQIEVDLDNIQQQLWTIQKENAALTDEVDRLNQAAAGTTSDEMGLRLEAVERDLGILRSRTDEADRRLAAVIQDLRATREALQALIATLPAAEGAAVALAPEGSGAPRGAAAPLAQGETASLALEDLYRQGYADYTKGNYALALQELGEFVERFPDSPLADDAQYLIGEVHFSQRQYPEAVEAFDHLIDTYRDGDKTGPAYLKKGLALLEMNRTADAVIQLQHVISAYPKSEEARIARDRLQALGLRER